MGVITQPLSDLFSNNILLKKIFSNLFYNFSLQRIILSSLEVLIFYFLIFISLIIIFNFFHKILIIQLQLKQKYVFLEVRPLDETLQSSYSTQQLFILIHSLAKQRNFFQRLIGNEKVYTFEIVSTKNEGIRYLLRVNEEDVDHIKKSLVSYLPGINILQIPDYFSQPVNKDNIYIMEFKLANHFAFPLKNQEKLSEYDPIAYITGSMTKMTDKEIVAFQLVASPLNKNKVYSIKRISNLIYSNKDLVEGLKVVGAKNLLFNLVKLILLSLLYILILPIGLFVFLISGGREGPFLGFKFNDLKLKTSNPYQDELERMLKGKLDQPLFNVSLRFLVLGNKKNAYKRTREFVASLSSFTNSSYQSIVVSRNIPIKYFEKLKLFRFSKRLPNFFNNSILSISEITNMYHFPFTKTTQTEDLQKVHSKELPAPISLKKAEDLDVIFAKNIYVGNTTMIGLNQEERRRHMYILGSTGTGKSTLLLSMIKEDIEKGKGVAVIDPHGELIENVLQCIPKKRIKDVIYFNPDDISFPIGINLLELPTNLSGDLLLREKELITESIISLFHKIYEDKYSGPRMEYILRNTIHTAFTTPNPTLFTIYKLLINEDFRKEVTDKLEDENLHDFWKYEFGKAGDYQKVQMISPITNKIGRFLFSPIAKRILEQEKSTINFDNIMDSGKILLSNVSKGKIGEDNSEVFGVLIITKIQLAALKRARIKSSKRRDFYLYVDEFQNFATPSFAQILSEARKYRLNAILAHQTTSQIKDISLVNVTLANTGTIICFRTANPEDTRLILPQFSPYIKSGEIDNLPSFHFYVKINALHPEEPFSGETIPISLPENNKLVKKIIDSSRKNFGKKFVHLVKPVKVSPKPSLKPKPIRSEEQTP